VHPHALVYPLAVSIKSSDSEENALDDGYGDDEEDEPVSFSGANSPSAPMPSMPPGDLSIHIRKMSDGDGGRTFRRVSRSAPARVLMAKLRARVPTLIEQTLLVSRELLRVAILWHESWHEGLEEASRVYFRGNSNNPNSMRSSNGTDDSYDETVRKMMEILEPLHALIERAPPESLREVSFVESYGRDLHEAHDFCRRYQQTRNKADIDEAWFLYTQVYRKLNNQLPQLTVLDIADVSPQLYAARNMELAVPGTYRAGRPLVKIARVDPRVTVITSKQRPRKVGIVGSNRIEYKFLLKGHEDLRQDERVMQLFGLVNNLLQNDPDTSKSRLSITCYAVVPLSPNSGLIGWVPHCDTLHALIREYREARQIVLNSEHRLMMQVAPYDALTIPQKVEVFEYALDSSDGMDLSRTLWLKSPTSEIWLERRTCYTRTTALMSMVGYILGLGDRHPSNIMLERQTGQVVHIDFGDCFEVAMHREKFPEKIPFRLTRMLVKAMEVSGIEGSFRFTCEKVMRVLRENKESVMAVLEAFVYDPLFNWILMPTDAPAQAPTTSEVQTSSSLVFDTVLQNETEGSVVINERAVTVIRRVEKKLTGRDFGTSILDVREQVNKLIEQATSMDNLCQCYAGWCPFW